MALVIHNSITKEMIQQQEEQDLKTQKLLFDTASCDNLHGVKKILSANPRLANPVTIRNLVTKSLKARDCDAIEGNKVFNYLMKDRYDRKTIDSETGLTPMGEAIIKQNLHAVNFLFEKDNRLVTKICNHNKKQPPLELALASGSAKIVMFLLDSLEKLGKETNLEKLSGSNNYSYSAIHLAATDGDLKLAKKVIADKQQQQCSANDIATTINHLYTGTSTLNLAYYGSNDSLEVIKLLLENGADISTTDMYGDTFLHTYFNKYHPEKKNKRVNTKTQP